MSRGKHLGNRARCIGWVLGIWVSMGFVSMSRADLFTFSGGNGSPLTVTLNETITYTITSEPAAETDRVIFVFRSVCDPELAGFSAFVSGSIAFSVNENAPQSITTATNHAYSLADIGPDDLYFYGGRDEQNSVSPGDVITLHPGSLTTNVDYPAPPPEDGDYGSHLVDDGVGKVSGNGLFSIPDPNISDREDTASEKRAILRKMGQLKRKLKRAKRKAQVRKMKNFRNLIRKQRRKLRSL